jgi:GTP-binding protein EngB required for normal cell division
MGKDAIDVIEEIKQRFLSFGKDISSSLGDLILTLIETLQISRDRKFVFLLVGRTGVGKSSTINSLMGAEVAKTGKYDPTTMGVQEYNNEINGVEFTVIDTPGLCDDLPEKGNDEKYIELIQSKVHQVDCMWFATRLDEPRVTADEIRGIKIISEAFGSKVWEHSIIVFTRADKADDYLEDLREREKRIRSVIAEYTSVEIAESIPAVAVANGHEFTPDGKQWLGELWTRVFLRIRDQGAIPYLMATIDRMNHSSKRPDPNWTWGNGSSHKEKSDSETSVEEEGENHQDPKIEFSDELFDQVRKRLFTVVPILEKIGNVIGSAIGQLVGGKPGKVAGSEIGKAVGGTVGKVVDFLFGFF